MLRDQLRVVQGDKGLVCFYDRNDPRGVGESVGIRGSILYVHKRNERIVPTLVLFQSISGGLSYKGQPPVTKPNRLVGY